MMVAGIHLRDETVLQLARLLYDEGFDSAAKALVRGLQPGRPSVNLSHLDYEAILLALDDPPQALEELRGTLLAKHVVRLSVLVDSRSQGAFKCGGVVCDESLVTRHAPPRV